MKPVITSDPAPWRLMLSRLQGKQNLCCGTEGHCTKCVSSRRSWHKVHLSVAVLPPPVDGPPEEAGPTLGPPPAPATASGVPAPPPPSASLDVVTVVELTWRLPDDLRPPADPIKIGNYTLKQTNINNRICLRIMKVQTRRIWWMLWSPGCRPWRTRRTAASWPWWSRWEVICNGHKCCHWWLSTAPTLILLTGSRSWLWRRASTRTQRRCGTSSSDTHSHTRISYK